MNKNLLDFSPEVNKAITTNKPILALESTIISHGMPYPQNLAVAKNLENIARQRGVIPATICLMNGKIKIGLDDGDLLLLAKAPDVKKVSRSDFSNVLTKGEIGATTVAATMIAANLAGIKVFATGGIGGVHRNAEKTFDVSADLIEFSRTPVIVISAGVKAILDIPKTLEYLETLGVPVYGYKTNHFPAFYSKRSRQKVKRIDSVDEVVQFYKNERELGFSNGILLANSIPEEYEIPFEVMDEFIKQALAVADEQGVTGKSVTPFLLSKLVELSDGESLQANIKLVENNVRLGCKVAKVF
ncbi:MAG: pseudouridine-5'-phosphate glycosidase [Candidatus Cloacimonadota bacterium]|nr:pseudouridine-5'-phosphate glycosidase [Candidatus Cloacimonadota bacterium]